MRERRTFVLLLCLVPGCAQLGLRPAVPPDPPLKLLVAQITMHAPLSSPADLQSFDQPPPSEEEPLLLARLIEEVEKKAQQLFTEQLAQQPGFHVVPFAEARQVRASLDSTHKELDIAQLGALGVQTGADIVLTGRILDYGKSNGNTGPSVWLFPCWRKRLSWAQQRDSIRSSWPRQRAASC